jgi:hypothetical protein
LIRTGFLLVLYLDPEDGSDMSSETTVYFYWTTRRYITDDITLHSHACENLISEYLFDLTAEGSLVKTLLFIKLL